MDIQKYIKTVLKENIDIRRANKKLVENIEIDFEMLNLCLDSALSTKEREIFIKLYNTVSSRKYMRHKVFNTLQRRKHKHARIN